MNAGDNGIKLKASKKSNVDFNSLPLLKMASPAMTNDLTGTLRSSLSLLPLKASPMS